MTGPRTEALDCVLCIHYPAQFKKDTAEVRALIDLGSEVNAMAPAYAKKLGLRVRKTDVSAQKIDGSTLETYSMVIAGFQVQDKFGKARFFQETFLVADTSVEVVLGMPFLALSKVEVDFAERELTWKAYTIAEALPTTKRVQIIGPKEFAKAALDPNQEAFVVHVATSSMEHSDRGVQVAALIADEAPITIPAEYSDFEDVFSKESAAVLPEHTEINTHAIDLEEGKQPPYGPIYSLGPVELETLKTYIKTNLANGFICPSKSPAGTPILFDKKPDGSFCLYVDYQGLNNITIKNQYPLLLVGESLDRLDHAKRFIQLDLTSSYHQMKIKEGDKWKTVFQTRYGHFEYQMMLFGLINASGSFQGYINKILAEKLDIFFIVYLDDILIYIEDPGKTHVEAVRWVLEVIRKYALYANLKKYCFHKNKVRFLGFVISRDGIRMEEERIDVVKKWPKPQSVREIQVFIGFANFYRHFIKGFSRMVAPLTAMLKTTGSSVASAFRVDDNEAIGGRGAGGRSDALRKSAKSKSQTKSGHLGNSNNSEEHKFLTSNAREAFNRLRQAFTKAPILRHFDPKYHIRIKTDASGYAIGGVLNQLTLNQVISNGKIGSNVDWHPVAYFSRKMIPTETRYKTYDGELLAIVEAFKTWRYYLEGCKHEVLVFTDYKNFCQFIDTKSLSSRQVRWAQELS